MLASVHPGFDGTWHEDLLPTCGGWVGMYVVGCVWGYMLGKVWERNVLGGFGRGMYVCAREGVGEVCTYVLGRVWERYVCMC